MSRLFALCILTLTLQACGAWQAERSLAKISRADLLDKVQGGWAGQMIGVSVGGPTEFQASEAPYDRPLIWDQPTTLATCINQDDLYVEMTFAKVMDDEGLDAPAAAYAKAFGASQYGLWHANYFARKNIQAGIMPPLSGHPQFNPHADDIDFQIEADFIGLMCPGMPVLSNHFCDRIGRVMNYGDGLYGGMFISGMYAAAFFENDPAKIVQAGLAAIPAQSDYALAIREAIRLHQAYPGDWRRAWKDFYRDFVNTDACPELANHPVDIDAKINGAFIALGLLYGEGDFKKTVSLAIAAGQDSDCNGATAGGILGTMLGFGRLPREWTSEVQKIRRQKFAFTNYSYDDICASTMRRIEKSVALANGRLEGETFLINRQAPRPAPLESWHAGRPIYFVRHDSSLIKWYGVWTAGKDQRFTSQPGDKVSLTFEGTGFIIHLLGGQPYGVADIYLDGKKVGSYDGYRPYGQPETQFFYKTIARQPGRHQLEVVNTGGSDAKATGKNLGLVGVQIFGRGF